MNTMVVAPPTSGSRFLDFAAAASDHSFDGKLLKFNKGDYLVGADGTALPEGTQLVPVMNTASVFWQKWLDGRPVDYRRIEGFRPPRRARRQRSDDLGS